MGRDLILHAGMHKTGTSSIQASLFRRPVEGFEWFDYEQANHSALFELLTAPSPETFHVFASRGYTAAQVAEMRSDWGRRLDDYLSGDGPGILSGEHMSAPDGQDRIRAFSALLDRAGARATVYLYIRPPIGYINSAFQQRLKGGAATLDMQKLWPRYRARVEQFDQVFGRENVLLRPYHPWTFPDGDVMCDFATWIGFGWQSDWTVRTNESLGAASTSLLYVQRRFGSGLEKPSQGAPTRNGRWIKTLRGLDSGRFVIGPELTEQAIGANRADLDWIEARMGCALQDRQSAPDGVVVNSEDDLIAIAKGLVPELQERLRGAVSDLPAKPNKRTLAQMLEALRALS